MPVACGGVILDKPTLIGIEMFNHRKKVINQKKFVLICLIEPPVNTLMFHLSVISHLTQLIIKLVGFVCFS